MKLEKRQFARLKDIAEEINTSGMFGLGGIKLNKLIADIESVQKVKTIKEKPLSREIYERPVDFMERIYNQHRQEVEANIQKEHEAVVAIRTGGGSMLKGIRTTVVKDADSWNKFMSKLHQDMPDNTEPKIGDVGYFWTTGNDTRYGKIKEIGSCEFKGKTCTVYRINNSDGCEYYVHFSKTPPDLK